MRKNLTPYMTFSPRIVPSNTEQCVEIRPRYSFVELSGKYFVSILPRYQYEYDSEKIGSFYESFEVIASDGFLKFKVKFGVEQEYQIQVVSADESTQCLHYFNTAIYALDEDLYHRHVVKGDLHLHTTYSDGLESPEFCAVMARKNGFDFIAITDHNRYHASIQLIEKMRKCPNNMIIIRGEEVHATGSPVHILSLGSSYPIAPLVTNIDSHQSKILSSMKEKYQDKIPPDVDLGAFVASMDVFNKIRESGGLSALCHIYWDATDYANCKRLGAPEQLINALVQHRNFDAFEITSGAPANDLKANYLQEAYYRENLPNDFPIIGVTDSHTMLDGMTIFGKNYTIVFIEDLSEEGILSAIRDGKTVSIDGVGTNLVCHGSLRLIKYASFLLKHYFPLHDSVVQTEGDLMQRILEGNFQLLNVMDNICNNSAEIIQAEWRTLYPRKRYVSQAIHNNKHALDKWLSTYESEEEI